MAGKSWQPNHEPPCRKGKQAHITLNKQWKERAEWEGGGFAGQCGLPLPQHCKFMLKAHKRLKQRAHGIPMNVHIPKLLTTREC